MVEMELIDKTSEQEDFDRKILRKLPPKGTGALSFKEITEEYLTPHAVELLKASMDRTEKILKEEGGIKPDVVGRYMEVAFE